MIIIIRLGEEGDPLGIVKEIGICPHDERVHALTRICSREWDSEDSPRFWVTYRSANPNHKIKPSVD